MQCRRQAKEVGMPLYNLTVADIAYLLVTARVVSMFRQQLIHVCNGYVSDDQEHLPFVRAGNVNFHSTGHHLVHYQSQ